MQCFGVVMLQLTNIYSTAIPTDERRRNKRSKPNQRKRQRNAPHPRRNHPKSAAAKPRRWSNPRKAAKTIKMRIMRIASLIPPVMLLWLRPCRGRGFRRGIWMPRGISLRGLRLWPRFVRCVFLFVCLIFNGGR